MASSVTMKILKSHCREGVVEPGKEIGILIDQTLTQDATGTMAYLQFEAIGIPRVRTELSVSYVDHNTLQTDFMNMDDHLFLQTAAAKFGVHFSRPGNGICHQVHLEQFGIPGKTLLGSDSHTPTGGGLGMLAIGTGGLDVAVAMAGGLYYITCPEVVGVKLTGRLSPFCSAKDLILTILGGETVKGGVGKVYEYFGPGVSTLSVYERATITNMGAELGATSSIFPSDEVTREFLTRQGRGDQWLPLAADPGAAYARIIEMDLSAVEPMAAAPHMPDRVVPVRSLSSVKVDQVVIGSCTNSSLNDLGAAADILGGGTVAATVSLGIAPGSRQILLGAYKAGIIQRLVESGARILEAACGPCIGMGFAPCTKGVSLRTFNRNFKGRSGSEEAEVYLVSPETAACSALTGFITDPRTMTARGLTRTDYSPFITVDRSMIIPPLGEPDASRTVIVRGPNIAELPAGTPLPENIELHVIIKTGDNITTDDIMPAGAKILPLRSNIPAISRYVFSGMDPGFAGRAEAFRDTADKAPGAAGMIVGGENYGQGSSREHAALAPLYLGIRAVLAKSFARIHKANLVNFGILPLTFADPRDYDRIEQGDTIILSGIDGRIMEAEGMDGRIARTGAMVRVRWELETRARKIIRSGGLLRYTREGSRETGGAGGGGSRR